MKAHVNKDLCQGCGGCTALCSAITFVCGKAGVIKERCTGCGKCIDICSNSAIVARERE